MQPSRPIYQRDYFNPRTREGCDFFALPLSHSAQDFNPRTREGCDTRLFSSSTPLSNFNPRTPRGVRRQTLPKSREFALAQFAYLHKGKKAEHTKTNAPMLHLSFPLCFLGANRPEKACHLGLRTLQNQRFVWKVGLLKAKVLDLLLIAISQGIKAEAVPFGIHDRTQLGLKQLVLGRIQLALKDGVLNRWP